MSSSVRSVRALLLLVAVIVVVSGVAVVAGSRADSTPVSRPGEMPVVAPVPVAQMFAADDPVLAAAGQRDDEAH